MSLSPAQRWLAQCANNAGETSPVIAATPSNTELRLLELETDKKALKALTAIADKIDYKRTVLVPKYRPAVEIYLASGAGYENPIFGTFILWLFDVGELDTFIKWCLIAIDKKIPTPDHIKRNWQTFCADSVFAWAEKQADVGNSIEPYFSQVFELIDSGQWRLFEKISAKFYKLAGQQILRSEDGTVKASHVGDVAALEKALGLLIKANELHNKIGVGDLIKSRIPARIKALTDGTNL